VPGDGGASIRRKCPRCGATWRQSGEPQTCMNCFRPLPQAGVEVTVERKTPWQWRWNVFVHPAILAVASGVRDTEEAAGRAAMEAMAGLREARAAAAQ